MKVVLILTALLLVSSCGNNKLRFKRVPFNKQEIVNLNEDKDPSKKKQEFLDEADKPSASPIENAESIEIIDEPAHDKIAIQPQTESLAEDIPVVTSDTLESDGFNSEEERTIAKKAEDISTIAVWLNRGALIVVVLSGVFALFIFDGLPLLIGGIFGFVMGILAIILGFVSKSKPYNTDLGSRQSSKAIIFGFIITLLFGFVLLLTADAI